MPYLRIFTQPGKHLVALPEKASKAPRCHRVFLLGVLLGLSSPVALAKPLPATLIQGPSAATPHVQASYSTVMADPHGRRVIVGKSYLFIHTAPAHDPYPTQPQASNLKQFQKNLLKNAGKLSPLPGGVSENAPLTPQQQALTRALTGYLTPLRQITPEDVLKPTFSDLKRPS